MRASPAAWFHNTVCESWLGESRRAGGPGSKRLAGVDMDRRSMLLTTGIGMLTAAAAIRVPEARGHPSPPAPPPAPPGPYMFPDQVCGPAGAGPRPGAADEADCPARRFTP